jgi:hypothetical protein
MYGRLYFVLREFELLLDVHACRLHVIKQFQQLGLR